MLNHKVCCNTEAVIARSPVEKLLSRNMAALSSIQERDCRTGGLAASWGEILSGFVQSEHNYSQEKRQSQARAMA